MKKTTTFPLAAALAVVLGSVSNADTVAYAETFSRTSGNGLLSVYNWNAYMADGVAVTSTTDAFVSATDGRPINLANAGQIQTGQLAGGIAIGATSSGNAFFAYTTEYNGMAPLTRSNLHTISLYNLNSVAMTYHVALQIGGSWYASTSMGTASIGTSTNFATQATQLSLSNFTASDWAAINFTVGSPLSLGPSGQALPEGTITAFGVYIERPSPGVSRFDSFVISVKPEPPSDPYQTWDASYPLADLSDPTADNDDDGLSNFREFAFGLDPTSGASVNPITEASQLNSGTFSYTRLAESGLTYTVWAATDLQDWGTEPVSVTEDPGPPVDGVVTVVVTLNTPPTADKLFVRVKAVSTP